MSFKQKGADTRTVAHVICVCLCQMKIFMHKLREIIFISSRDRAKMVTSGYDSTRDCSTAGQSIL